MKKISLPGIFLFILVYLCCSPVLFAQKQGQAKLDSLMELLRRHTTNDTSKVNLLNNIAWEMQSINPPAGIEMAGKARKLSEDLDYSLGIANSYLGEGVCYYSQSDDKVALENYNKALKVLTDNGDRSTLATVYLNIGNVYFNKREFKTALEYYNKALKSLEEINDKKRCASVYGNIGNLYYVQGEYKLSLEYQNKAYDLAVISGNMKVQGNSLLGIANIYSRLPDYPKSLESYYKALKVFESTGNKKATASTYGSIGIIYYRQQENDKALENFYKARMIADEIGDKRGSATTLTNIGNVFIQVKDYNKALDNHMRAYELFQQIGFKSGMASAMGNVASVYSELGNYEKALYYYQQAYAENCKANNKSSELYNLKGIGTVYLRMITEPSKLNEKNGKLLPALSKNQCLDSVVKYSEMAIVLGKELSELDPMIDVYRNLSKAYQLKNDWKKAFYYTDSSQVLQDSVFSEANKDKIEEIGAKQAEELKEKEIQIIALKLKQQKAIVWAISVGLVLMIIIVLLIYRSLQIKKRTNTWLEKEVLTRTNELVESNRKLEEVNAELIALEETKAEFLKFISHQIRTPLNSVIGFTHMLKEEVLSPEFSDIIFNIDKSVKRLERFSKAALLLTGQKNKNVTINAVDNHLPALIDRVLLQTEQAVLHKDITFEFKGDIDKITIRGDAELLNICLETIVDNAIKFSNTGGIIFIKSFQTDTDVVVEVEDQGQGFSDDIIEKIQSLLFIKEKKFENTAGLSLALVKMIMEVHRGSVMIGNIHEGGAFVRLNFLRII